MTEQLNSEDLGRVKVKKYFDEKDGKIYYSVQIVHSHFAGWRDREYLTNYYWRIMKDGMGLEQALAYKRTYEKFLEEDDYA